MSDILGLPDEEFLKQDMETLVEKAESSHKPEEDSSSPASPSSQPAEDMDNEEVDDTEEDTPDSEAQKQPTEDSPEDTDDHLEDDDPLMSDNPTEKPAEEPSDTDNPPEDTKEDTPETDGDIDYESAYKRITSPFKANGTEMKVNGPDEVIKLMQMGANYSKKMAQLKPHLKIVKMLEKHNLLDMEKLGNIIDITNKKDPHAIAKFLKDNGIDPLEIDTEEGADYKPSDYSISDTEYHLDNVLNDIKDTPTFARTINLVSKEWSDSSREIISKDPEILGIINTHMQNGVFDVVNGVLEKEKALGNLGNMAEIEAYKSIALALAEKGALAASTETASPEVSKKPNQKAAIRNKKRKAAAPASSKVPVKETLPENFLGMSDEEFLKKYARR